jgi:hypothetical protein
LRANFAADYYAAPRSFYARVKTGDKQQIVLKTQDADTKD